MSCEKNDLHYENLCTEPLIEAKQQELQSIDIWT